MLWLQLLKGLKFRLAEKIKQHPYTLAAVWNRMPRLGFLLPHDRSYFGFPLLARESGGLFLDVGANNGISAAGFRKLVGHYDILSLEASELHRPALQSLKDRLDNFDYRIVGAGSQPGTMTLYTPIYRGRSLHTHTSSSRDYLNTSLRRDFSERVVAAMRYREQQVDICPIDDMQLDPDIVKIDVEGFDYQVLQGMKDTVSRCRPIFLVEFTPEHMEDFFEFFSKRDYRLYIYLPAATAFREFDHKSDSQSWRQQHLQVNIFCVPVERSASVPLAG